MAESSSPIPFALLARYARFSARCARTILVSWLAAVTQWLKCEWPESELADSRKLAKQILLPKKETRLLTNLRFLNPPPALRVSQARLITTAQTRHSMPQCGYTAFSDSAFWTSRRNHLPTTNVCDGIELTRARFLRFLNLGCRHSSSSRFGAVPTTSRSRSHDSMPSQRVQLVTARGIYRFSDIDFHTLHYGEKVALAPGNRQLFALSPLQVTGLGSLTPPRYAPRPRRILLRVVANTIVGYRLFRG